MYKHLIFVLPCFMMGCNPSFVGDRGIFNRYEPRVSLPNRINHWYHKPHHDKATAVVNALESVANERSSITTKRFEHLSAQQELTAIRSDLGVKVDRHDTILNGFEESWRANHESLLSDLNLANEREGTVRISERQELIAKCLKLLKLLIKLENAKIKAIEKAIETPASEPNRKSTEEVELKSIFDLIEEVEKIIKNESEFLEEEAKAQDKVDTIKKLAQKELEVSDSATRALAAAVGIGLGEEDIAHLKRFVAEVERQINELNKKTATKPNKNEAEKALNAASDDMGKSLDLAGFDFLLKDLFGTDLKNVDKESLTDLLDSSNLSLENITAKIKDIWKPRATIQSEMIGKAEEQFKAIIENTQVAAISKLTKEKDAAPKGSIKRVVYDQAIYFLNKKKKLEDLKATPKTKQNAEDNDKKDILAKLRKELLSTKEFLNVKNLKKRIIKEFTPENANKLIAQLGKINPKWEAKLMSIIDGTNSADSLFNAMDGGFSYIIKDIYKEQSDAYERLMDFMVRLSTIEIDLYREQVRHHGVLVEIAKSEAQRWSNIGQLYGKIQGHPLNQSDDKMIITLRERAQMTKSLMNQTDYQMMIKLRKKAQEPEVTNHKAIIEAYKSTKEAVSHFINNYYLRIYNRQIASANSLMLNNEIDEHKLHLGGIVNRVEEEEMRYSALYLEQYHSTGIRDTDVQALMTAVLTGFLASDN